MNACLSRVLSTVRPRRYVGARLDMGQRKHFHDTTKLAPVRSTGEDYHDETRDVGVDWAVSLYGSTATIAHRPSPSPMDYRSCRPSTLKTLATSTVPQSHSSCICECILTTQNKQ
ncbi:hypothetical protein PMIN03_006159 [Paraphaeosphaeria minitans]